LKFYLGDAGASAADAIGEQEDQWIGRDKKKQTEKKNAPPPARTQREPTRQPQPQQRQPSAQQAQPARGVEFAHIAGAGANQGQAIPVGGGGKYGEKEKGPDHSRPAAFDGAADHHSGEADERSDRDSYDEGTEAQRFWWTFGR